jgi:MraZ protein
MSFAGTADHTLDPKKRLSVSTRHRSSLSGPIVLAQEATAACVTIWPKEVYEQQTEAALEGLNPISQAATEIRRFRYGRSQEAELDGNGRVSIPAFLVKHAKLEKDVTVVGAGDHLEIWDRATWSVGEDDLATSMAKIIEGL